MYDDAGTVIRAAEALGLGRPTQEALHYAAHQARSDGGTLARFALEYQREQDAVRAARGLRPRLSRKTRRVLELWAGLRPRRGEWWEREAMADFGLAWLRWPQNAEVVRRAD